MATSDDDYSSRIMDHLTEMEVVAEDILASRQEIIELDRRRQKTREAQRVLSKDKKNNKQWMCFGNMFLKIPTVQTKKLLEKDFNQLDEEIGKLRKDLKPKVNKLRDLEHKDDIKGYDLTPLTKQELNMVEMYCD